MGDREDGLSRAAGCGNACKITAAKSQRSNGAHPRRGKAVVPARRRGTVRGVGMWQGNSPNLLQEPIPPFKIVALHRHASNFARPPEKIKHYFRNFPFIFNKISIQYLHNIEWIVNGNSEMPYAKQLDKVFKMVQRKVPQNTVLLVDLLVCQFMRNQRPQHWRRLRHNVQVSADHHFKIAAIYANIDDNRRLIKMSGVSDGW